MRVFTSWLLAWVVLVAVLAFGALALIAAPVVLLAAVLLARRRTTHARSDERGAVYEGEFRVLDLEKGS